MSVTILFTKDDCPECEDLRLRGLCDDIQIESANEAEGLASMMFYNMPVKELIITPCLYCGEDEECDIHAVRLYGDALVYFLEGRKEG